MQDLKTNIFKQFYPNANGFSPDRWLEEEVNPTYGAILTRGTIIL